LTIYHRDELNAVQKELAGIPGVTVLIYDQTCAAEKRRRRKRHTYPDPDKRVIINELVCEGCGDCGVVSNCVSVQPLETEWGRKRTIDQSSCNKDFSCVKGFCPSFVTIHGAKLKKGIGVAADHDIGQLPEPRLPAIDQTYNIIVTGVGGTGIVTIGGVLGMAAHLEGRGVGVLDMAGLAQKGGAVYSHIRFANRPDDIHAIRVAAGRADVVLGGDIIVAGTRKVLAAVKHGATQMVVNTSEFLPGEFTRNADFSLPSERLKRTIVTDAGRENAHFIDATRLANALFGQSIGANMFLVGYAYQLGAIPLSAAAIERAIELNGEAVAMNQAAFHWGRRAAIDRAAVEALAEPASGKRDAEHLSESFDEMIERRVEFLTKYQNADYAQQYRTVVDKVKAVEAARAPDKCGLADAVGRYLFKLMAYKDEYEVARLYTDGSFEKQVEAEFGGDNLRFEFHLAPPLLARRDKTTGLPRKMSFGPWIVPAFRLSAAMKVLRGTVLDPFAYSRERRTERKLIEDYRAMLDEVLANLTSQNHHLAVGLAVIPEKIRGFGHVKQRHLQTAKADEAALLEQFRAGAPALLKAAE
jgi:indolepyruvate ferredoxin oxidoreductase